MSEFDDDKQAAERAYARGRLIRSLVLNGIGVALLAVAGVLAFGHFSWQLSIPVAFAAFGVVVWANMGD